MCFPCSVSIIAATENHSQLQISMMFSTLAWKSLVDDLHEVPPSRTTGAGGY